MSYHVPIASAIARHSRHRLLNGASRPVGLALLALGCATLLASVPVLAADQTGMASMAMTSASGGDSPQELRDPSGDSDGYTYGDMPGFEHVDQLPIGKVFAERLEGLSEDGHGGFGWNVEGWYGPDTEKLWVRTEGFVLGARTDATSDAEALWWHAVSPFWAMQLGVRQDLGTGAHSYAAVGIQGLTPYWLEVAATGYIGEDGRLTARLEGWYDLLLTNRLILTPSFETNVYDRADPRRDQGAGLGDIEGGLRLRYEITRKLAPYIGYEWVGAVGRSAQLQRAAGEPELDKQLVAGLRLWW